MQPRTALHRLIDERGLEADAFGGRPIMVVQPAIMAALRPCVGRASIAALRAIDVWRIGPEPRVLEWSEAGYTRFVLLQHLQNALVAQYAHWARGGSFVSRTGWLVTIGDDGALGLVGPALPHERETVLRGVAAALLLPYAQIRAGGRFLALPKETINPRGLDKSRAAARRRAVPEHDWRHLPADWPHHIGVEFVEARLIETPRGAIASMPHFRPAVAPALAA